MWDDGAVSSGARQRRGEAPPGRPGRRPPGSSGGPSQPSLGVSALHGTAGGVEDCPVRHCWVSGAVDVDGVTRPGMLVEWRRGAGGWEGLVVRPERRAPGVWVLVQQWVPARLLSPR